MISMTLAAVAVTLFEPGFPAMSFVH